MLVTVAFLVVTERSVAAQAITTTVNLDGFVSVEPGDPACPSGFGTDTFTFTKGVAHETQRPDGTIHATLTGEGSFSQVPFEDLSVPTCDGHFVFWQGESGGSNAQPASFTANIQMSCTDGSVFHLHWAGHALVLDEQLHLETSTFRCH
jgi:hypothetical protein